MNLVDAMKKNNTITNTKGGEYYQGSWNNNLDLFAMLSRFDEEDRVVGMFNRALDEDETLALANLLYILDIRGGRGERLLFNTIFHDLCVNKPELALRILPFIGELGRYDYILTGIDTPIEDEVISLIKKQLEIDDNSDNPSLLAKWLPSHRTHNKNNWLAKKIMIGLNLTEKEYRKKLAKIRSKINIVEKNLTEKNYDLINFSEVPTKAMLKYNKAYIRNMKDKYEEYKDRVKNGEVKINTTGLFVYEIVKKIITNSSDDYELFDLMWNNQKDIFKGNNSNVLVVADTSGSMTVNKLLPLSTSIGLAIYTALRNNGIFKNYFITFSENPILQKVEGKTIVDKVRNIRAIVSNTDIDKVFKLILDAALENKISDKDMPSHILIISDMEFDRGVYSKEGTNFKGWKKAFSDAGYKLPKIIFWNVAATTFGVPVTKFDNDVAMIGGFSTNVLENILSIENYSPVNVMMEKLKGYLDMLKR